MAQDGEAAALATIHPVARRVGVWAATVSRVPAARITGGEPAGSPQVLPTRLVIRSSSVCPGLSPSTDA